MSQLSNEIAEIKLNLGAQRNVTLNGKVYTWHENDRLGGGAQGSIYKATCKEGGTIIALKLAEHTTSRNDREHENLMRLNHPNVVKYIGHSMHGKDLAIGMTLVVGVSYDEYLKTEGPLHWSVAGKDFTQLIDGMAAVHAQGILHRDLKPANIMRKKNGPRH
jgi:serine/threonine protein kinase